MKRAEKDPPLAFSVSVVVVEQQQVGRGGKAALAVVRAHGQGQTQAGPRGLLCRPGSPALLQACTPRKLTWH